jgi:hypothetical protein
MSRWMKIALAAALALSLAGFASACGGTDLGDIDEGESFKMGDLRYNVLYDRFLNPQQIEDGDYVKGLPTPPEGKAYYGVFVLVKNEGGDTVTLPDASDFKMSDTLDDVFTPVDNSTTDFGFPFGQPLPKDSEVPDPDSIAAAGPTQGSVVLYLVDQNVTESRPLELEIDSEGETATIKLDV